MASKIFKKKGNSTDRKLRDNIAIDSHSSSLTNQRIFYLFCEVDKAAIVARNNLHLETINSYFGCIDQVWNNTADVLTNADDCLTTRREYVKQYKEILGASDEELTALKLFNLLDQAIKFNRLVVSGLQDKLHYFFRVSLKQRKGLPSASEADLFEE